MQDGEKQYPHQDQKPADCKGVNDFSHWGHLLLPAKAGNFSLFPFSQQGDRVTMPCRGRGRPDFTSGPYVQK